jgi:hypothetical protein
MTRAITIGAATAAALVALSFASSAAADTCWNHNGSVMRLTANGQDRTFSYEQPRSTLVNAGVGRGTTLFDGVRSGNRYNGTAYVFSRDCPGSPLPYSVQGSVSRNDTQVTLTGTRPVYANCRATGRSTTDTLVFTYVSDC